MIISNWREISFKSLNDWKGKEDEFKTLLEHTLYNTILRTARNFLETRENVKISTRPFYHINLGWFSWEWSKKKFFFSKKKFKMADSKKAHFSKSPILKIFSRKSLRSVLWLVGLNDAKGIFESAILNFFFEKKKNFFASFPWKSAQIYMVELESR